MNTEKDLFQLVKKSDEEAFEILFRLYYQPLVQYCSKYIQDNDLAKGLIQDVFVKVWENRKTLPNQAPAPYLYQAAKNKCLNNLRHEKVKNTFCEEESDMDISEEIELQEKNDTVILIYKSIDKLPEQCKKVFIMSRMNGLKHKEIAEEMGIAVKTVKNQIGKALKHLKDDLSHLNIGLIICIIELLRKNL